MREYIHGFCNLDMKGVGLEEYAKGTQITCALFREMFLQSMEKQPTVEIDKQHFEVY